MCGITGYFSPLKKLQKTELAAMNTAIAHRGPDAEGYYFNEAQTVGLGHRRLSIIDLSEAANQPMYSHDGRYVIVFNGEIYNYREVAKELKVTLKTTSDTEVLLEAFAVWGVDCIHHINGMFAFAVYDTKENRLYLFRDRIGIKPIFYYSRGTEFYFSSELKSFYSLPGFDFGGISTTALHHYLYLGYIPAPDTIYNNVHKFPAGSYAIIDKTGLSVHAYWRLEEQISQNVITDYTEAKKELTALLESSVRYRMISDVPFGTFLSGGIDSSIVTAFAQKNSERPVNTFSIAFKEQSHNEAIYARKVAKHLGTNHHEFECSYANALELFDSITGIYDEPYADCSMFPTMLVSKFARQHVTMILSGDGGDENFFGYGFYNWGNRLRNPFIKNLRMPAAKLLRYLPSGKYKRAATLFEYAEDKQLKSHIFSQEQYCFAGSEIEQLLKSGYKGKVQMDEGFTGLSRDLSMNEEQALFDLKYYMPDDLLVKVDRASMYYSLEVRVPLLDYRLVKFAHNIHPSLRKKGNVAKYLLKEVLYEMVPKNFFERPKWGFAVPIENWLQKEWRHLIEDYLSETAINSNGIFRYSYVRDLVKRFESGEKYLYNRLWLLILFQKWYGAQKR